VTEAPEFDRSQPPATRTNEARPVIDLAEGEGLAAVASLWRKTGRELRARFGGSSMAPALPPGTELLLRCGEAGAPGDVIAFMADGRVLVHRVVARAADGSWTLTRGDARVLPDVPIRDPEAVVGRVAGMLRAGSLEGVPAAVDSLSRRLVLGVTCAFLRASPNAATGVLKSLHTATRLTRSVGLKVGRHSART
jgi:hypothetical protein